MKKRTFNLAFMACILHLFLSFQQANASLTTETIDFTASNFTDTHGHSNVAPVSPVIGSITVTYDPLLTYGFNDLGAIGVTSGITLNSLNIALNSQIAFAYNPTGGVMAIGGSNSFLTVYSNTNNFYLTISNDAYGHFDNFGGLVYAQVGFNDDFLSTTGTFTVTNTAPIPDTMLLLGSGLAGLAAFKKKFKSLA
jgi:hypothetical protein